MDDKGSERLKRRRMQQGDMLHRSSATLLDPSAILIGIDPVIERRRYPKPEILSAFGSIDDLLVRIAERKAALLAAPLVDCGRIVDLQFVRCVLTDFGRLAWNEYSTSIIALVRLMMTEGARSPGLKKRIYKVGPFSVTCQLRQFFTKAHGAGVLNAPQANLAAEHLLGMLREPLYEALMLNPATASASNGAGKVSASVDLVLDGCKRGRA
ncbi:TetR/AcrR family transcriptional regulator C-terminal domain-containing protein [Sphingobium herbicidovorans]|nr:TetR/AcrR family transcriptional regulator C-terminal domain-containing protein [Kaistia sp.]